ncbi:MAG: ECF transporter S component [Treponema sp.]|nr:ECF transporter S component [Treponema sp.]
MKKPKKIFAAKMVALIAILTAVTTVLTLIVRIPFAPTRGYITLADVGVYFASFALGPVVGTIAGGVGTGLADAISGYPQWMILSCLIHGLQGLAAGLIGRKGKLVFMILGCVTGAVIMVGGYFISEVFLYGIGAAAAEIPGNLFQNAAGAVIGIPLVYAVKKAYPPINEIGKKQTWKEV